MSDTKVGRNLTIGGFSFILLTSCSAADQQIAGQLIGGIANIAVAQSNSNRTYRRPAPIKVYTPEYDPITAGSGSTTYTGGGGYVSGTSCGGGICTGSCGIR